MADTLIIIGAELSRAIGDLRAQNADADAVFSALEKSSTNFAIVGSDEVSSLEQCCTRGFAGYSFDTKEPSFGGAPAELRATAPSARGIAFVDADASARRGRTPGMVALHEAVHLKGIADRNRMYLHKDCQAFRTEVAVGKAEHLAVSSSNTCQ